MKETRGWSVEERTGRGEQGGGVRFGKIIREIAEERIVILSTSISGDIEASCGEIDVMEEGKLLFRGTVEELLRSVRGKVFRTEISRHELDDLKERCIVTSMLTLGNNVMARFISEQKPYPGAERCEREWRTPICI